jgi:hypothetical protein
MQRKNVSYPDAVDALIRSAAASGVVASQNTPQGELAECCERVFGTTLANQIATHGYPDELELPWVAEELYVYGLNELSARQAGYRADARDGSPSADWDMAHFVIADWAANPITIAQDATVSYARHGVGAWIYCRIAPDLPTFFLLLAAWLDFLRDNGGNLYDDNFEIPDKVRADIRLRVAGVLDEPDRDAACRFVLGEL